MEQATVKGRPAATWSGISRMKPFGFTLSIEDLHAAGLNPDGSVTAFVHDGDVVVQAGVGPQHKLQAVGSTTRRLLSSRIVSALNDAGYPLGAYAVSTSQGRLAIHLHRVIETEVQP